MREQKTIYNLKDLQKGLKHLEKLGFTNISVYAKPTYLRLRGVNGDLSGYIHIDVETGKMKWVQTSNSGLELN
jgi:hypothetical protein